jgi:arylsulfatase A-like enzyme
MSRSLRPARPLLLLGAVALVAAVAFGALRWRTPHAGVWRAKQVVLITIDTLRADRLGLYGYRHRPTSPTLDTWAQSAVVFDRAMAPAPWTIPSLGALMTGRYPAEIGAYTNSDGVHDDADMLAELFREHGYATGNFNTHALLVNKRGGFRQGFDTVEPRHITPQLDGEHKAPFSITEPKLMEWLAAHREQPFFVWIHDMSPHLPPTEGNPYLISRRWTRYDAEVRFVDELIGRILGALRDLGFGDELLVIVTADHGEAFGDEHGLIGHQDVMYDEVLRVPLIVKYPAMGVPRRIAEPVEIVDLFATVAELAGVPLPAGTRSESLVPLITGTRAARAKPFSFHARYFFEDRQHWLAVRDHEWKLLGRTPDLGADRDTHSAPRWRVDNEDTTYFELYHIADDPAEQHDLYEQHPEQVARLQRVLGEWGTSVREGPARAEIDEATREQLRALGYE